MQSMFATKESHFGNVLKWIESEGGTGIGSLRFSMTNQGLACFTAKPVEKNELLFSIPRDCILSAHECLHSPIAERVLQHAADCGCDAVALVSCEFLLWLNMCLHRKLPSHTSKGMHDYMNSLSDSAPDVLSWSEELQQLLVGTALSPAVQTTTLHRLQAQCNLFHAACPQYMTMITLDDLIWARGHYLSRRYPQHFAAAGKSSQEHPPKIDLASGEIGMQNLGSLVPLLDILNHNSDENWLIFDVTDTHLVVRAGVSRNEGDELYSNYGNDRSNEALLYAYGFALENNLSDEVTLTLRAGNISKAFTLRDGGLTVISNDVWEALDALHEEEGDEFCALPSGVRVHPASLEALENFLAVKLATLTETNEAAEKWLRKATSNRKRKHGSSNEDSIECARYAGYYRQGQCRIIQQVLCELNEELDKFIESDDDNSSRCGSVDDNE